MKKRIISVILVMTLLLSGCSIAGLNSTIKELKGGIKGNTYTAEFYSNSGEKFMTASGSNIDIESNVVEEPVVIDGSWGHKETISSVITITIDGSQIESCGSTVLFVEDGLKPDVDFQLEDIKSRADGITDLTMIASKVNKYKNYFGKPTVVVIQSQLGDPICAFSGKDVYWEVAEDLPKTTRLSIDGKSLYIHRANFQIIDRDLLD